MISSHRRWRASTVSARADAERHTARLAALRIALECSTESKIATFSHVQSVPACQRTSLLTLACVSLLDTPSPLCARRTLAVGTIFAYGQTASGKTFTMKGSASEQGVIALAMNQVFESILTSASSRSYLLRVSYIEIYSQWGENI
jgi:hypothetical protein